MAPPGAPVFAPQEHAPDCVAARAHAPGTLAPGTNTPQHQLPALPPPAEMYEPADPDIPLAHPADKDAEPWLHEELGIKPGAVVRLEVSAESPDLYRCLLRYLASRAVDIDEKIPRVADALHDDPFCFEREFPGRLSSLYNSPMGTYLAYTSPPEKEKEKGPREVDIMLGLGWAKVAVFGEGKIMVRGKKKGMKLGEKNAKSKGKEEKGGVGEGKKHTENEAGKDGTKGAKESVEEMGENEGNTKETETVCEDHGSQEAELVSSSASNEAKMEEEMHGSATNSTEEGAVENRTKDAATRETADDEAEADSNVREANASIPNGKSEGVIENGITDAAAGDTKNSEKKKKKKAGVKRHVVVQHHSFGDPIAVGMQSKIYRTLVLYGESSDVVETLCRDALHWRKNRINRRREAVPGRFVLHTLDLGCCGTKPEWISRGHQLSRSLKSVILPPGMMEAIVKDVSSFRAEGVKQWYVEHGLPHRRSYLFYGPPGVGKTSTIRALAGKLKLPACFLCLGDRRIGNRTLQQALATIPRPSILVMEDVDVLFAEDRKNKGDNFLTFSGLLNVLDGMLSADGIVTVMTTNHVERLDPALMRAGRVDRKFEFKQPNTEQVADMFQRYYPGTERAVAERFAGKVFARRESDARSIATLQLHFIRERKRSAKECLQRLDQFFLDFYPNAAHRNRQGLYM